VHTLGWNLATDVVEREYGYYTADTYQDRKIQNKHIPIVYMNPNMGTSEM
jgi:hypothetical protein